MKVKYLGEIVRRRRKMLGLSQEQVCDGLCTPMTLSRFESGRQTPSRDCVEAILQRLGLPDDLYYAQLTREESQLVSLRKEARASSSQFEKTFGENRQQARMNALEKLRNLERCVKEDDHINQQFILKTRVTLEVYPPQQQLEMLMKAIRLTSPRFNPDEIGNCLYCKNEVAIINQIAIRYALCGQRGKAIDIYSQLLKLVQKNAPNRDRLTLIAYNYALHLASEKRWEEALEISALGRQACIMQGNYRVIPGFLHIEAECYYFMEKLNRSLELYRSAYHIYGAVMDTRNQEVLITDVKDRFNLAWGYHPEDTAASCPEPEPDPWARPVRHRPAR
ncbi:MAG: helix-turn-helix domain-containing protein [Oscillibacter sp.]|nr:helix-turn-helix domain-containing protein [Oscillibacter sp.]